MYRFWPAGQLVVPREEITTELFLQGTEPWQYCDVHSLLDWSWFERFLPPQWDRPRISPDGLFQDQEEDKPLVPAPKPSPSPPRPQGEPRVKQENKPPAGGQGPGIKPKVTPPAAGQPEAPKAVPPAVEEPPEPENIPQAEGENDSPDGERSPPAPPPGTPGVEPEDGEEAAETTGPEGEHLLEPQESGNNSGEGTTAPGLEKMKGIARFRKLLSPLPPRPPSYPSCWPVLNGI